MGTGTLKLGGSGRALVAVCVALGLAAAFAGPSCSSSDINGQRPDGGPVCQHGGNACASGTFCENGNCVATCPGGTCPSGQYCMGDASVSDEVCAATLPIVCSSLLDCPPPQECLGGLCTAAEPRADGGLALCDPSNSEKLPDGGTDDGCGPDAICVIINTSSTQVVQCRGMPACGQGNECFHGPLGSTCNFRTAAGNVRLLPAKQRLCLLGFCVVAGDCASGQKCVRDPDGGVAGGCYSGFPGSPCNSPADCLNPDAGCVGADAGVWGACGQ
jgi:hypothetical protein